MKASRLDKAIGSLILAQPFYAAMLLKQGLAIDEGEKTLATDGKTISYNPAFVDILTHDELVGCLAHEVLHVAHLHHTRLVGKDPARFNRAADYAINELLVEAGFRLPQGALIDRQYNGLSAEQIYGRLPASQDDDGQDPGGTGRVKSPPGPNGQQPSQADVTAAEQQAIIDTLQAGQAAKAAGKLSGGLAEYIQSLKHPQQDWRSLLWRYAERVAHSDYSFSRPNKRFAGSQVIMPGLYSRSMGVVAVLVDTSGSIDRGVLESFLAECQGILDTLRPECMVVIQCDTTVRSTVEYEPGDTLAAEVHGRGGTLFQPALDQASEYEPACVVYLTDGCNGDGTLTDPGIPVLWALYGATGGVSFGFGEVVHVDR